MATYLKWNSCPLECAWNLNPPLCGREECPVVPEIVEIEDVPLPEMGC